MPRARTSNGSSRRRRRGRSWPAPIQTPPKSRNHCDEVLAAVAEHAADRGARLTGSLLSFARKQALRPEVVDVNKLISEFSSLLQRAAGETIQLELALTASMAVTNADTAH